MYLKFVFNGISTKYRAVSLSLWGIRKEIIEILRQKSRPYLFSNTLAPAIVGASLKAIDLIENNKSIIVRLNDSGPYIDDRIIDLSKKAAIELEMLNKGTAKVRVQYIEEAPLDGNQGNYFNNSKPGFLRKIWRATSSALTDL